ncbi:Protein FAM8A1 [Acipenser ruthenus]|uniref:Protein FAM8A1 n=3 Tax=Acipenser ruthenus TaxID=7906 RepID=A0A662Z0T4_ACIRT|nr:Protein FAM8A1 [Acipenser ruthenus]
MADLGGGLDKLSASNSMDKTNIIAPKLRTGTDMAATKTRNPGHNSESKKGPDSHATASEYCGKVQEWMWQYYGYMNWQNWMAMSISPFPPCYSSYPAATQNGATPAWQVGQSVQDVRVWYNNNINQFPFPVPPYFVPPPVAVAGSQGQVAAGTTPMSARPVQQLHGNVQQAGREYTIPSPLHRFLAEIVDFFILFFIKASIVLSIMHFSGMKDISKFAMNYIVEEIDEDTSMEELQKMMIVALVYRVLVCFYEIICIWGAGGATPGKFLLGLRVVTCDTSVLVRQDRVIVMPASNVSLSASTVRALNKNFSIAFFFPAFITLLFFQHNRTVYDIVAGTIVVKRNGAR